MAAYSRYLRDNPKAAHSAEAEERIAALRVLAHQTIEAHEKFIETYPQSALLPELHVAMEPLYFSRARNENTSAAYRRFLGEYPDGQPRAARTATWPTWRCSSTHPSVATMREFMRQYPESDFATDAQRSLDLLSFRRETAIHHPGVRIEVSPNTAQPQRVRRGFVSVVARQYAESTGST